jgi:5-methylcytosine-specific restriction endonuclease McrA
LEFAMTPTSTLILNNYMMPHRVTSWQDAITELFTGKVEILEWYEEIIYSNIDRGITMKMPAVARLLKPVNAFKKGVKFSRVNVMARDNFVCQYCGEKRPMSKLNYDHVVPRVQGGKTEWLNIVTSCLPCNDKKGPRTPEQAKMKLIRAPFRPKTLPLAQPVLAMRNIPAEWEPFVAEAT